MFTGIVHDLADLKQAEEAATRLGRVLEDSLNEIFIFDSETLKFALVNRGGRENLGFSMRELADMSPLDIKPGFDEESFRELTQPLLDGAVESINFETVHERKDGSQYPVEVHLQRIGQLRAVVLETRDQIAVGVVLEVAGERVGRAGAVGQTGRAEVAG